MKNLIVLLALIFSATAHAQKNNESVDLEFKTQTRIIEAFLDSETLNNEYPEGAEASYADILGRDLRVSLSGGDIAKNSNIRVSLNCSKVSSTQLKCSLKSYSEAKVGNTTLESMLMINGDVFLPELSTEVHVTNIKAAIAG